MTVIINLVDTTEYFEVGNKVCFQLEAKLNASRFVDRWSDLGDKLYQAGSGSLDLISVPEHQYQFLKTALKAPEPRPEDIKPLRKVAFDDDKPTRPEPRFTFMASDKPTRPEPRFTFMTSDKPTRPEPRFTFMASEPRKHVREVPRYDLGSRKVVGFVVPVGSLSMGGGITFWPLK
jgi:hypothetical protein